MATIPIYTLTVYEEDDTTVLFTVSTDPAAVDPEKPYLKAPMDFAEQEVDFAKSSASIGQVTLEVVDVPTDPADQDTGYLTGLLADANGDSQINGHRARLTEDIGAGDELVLDGVIRSARLLDTFVTYSLELRDIRERERKTKAFGRTDTPTVLPPGVLNGYGRLVPTLGGSTRYPVPPTKPLRATYYAASATLGTLDFTAELADRRRVTAAVRAALEHTAPLDGSPDIYVFDRWKLLWKARGSGDPYTEITQLAHTHPSLPSGGGRGWQGEGTGAVRYMRIDNLVSGATLPTDEQDVDIIIQYDGPVSEDWPLHIDGLTLGELLRNAYRGDYSAEDPRIRYDEAALLALATRVRGRFTKPVEDLRKWAEKNAYPIAHAAPTLDSEGRISPTTYLLPDADEVVPELNDSNTRPVGGGWSHGSEDSINVVTVTYFQDYLAAEAETEDGARIPFEDRIRSEEAQHQDVDTASVALLGWNEIEIESELLRVVGSSSILPFFGDLVDEAGFQVAKLAGNVLKDRFGRGGQYVEIEGLRSDADVEATRVGSYRVLGQSWMPDYLSGTRGLSRLGQCVRRRNVNAAWCALTFVDAGSGAAPLGQPTLGTVTASDDGVVTIPVTALATGDPFARVDYAVSDTEPATGSELWTYLDRVDAIGDLESPPVGPDETVWVRARSEAVGRRPSAYTTPASVGTPAIPRVVDVRLEVDPVTNIGTVTWEPNALCAGVRVYPEVHDQGSDPAYASSEDVEGSVGELELAGLPVRGDDRVLSVRVEPYPGWTGSAVSGTAGPAVDVSQAAVVDLDLSIRIRVEAIPLVFNTARGYVFDLHYELGADVTHVQFLGFYGGDTVVFETVALTGSGIWRVQGSAGPDGSLFRTGSFNLAMSAVPRLQDGATLIEAGQQVNSTSGALNEIGSGARVEETGTGDVLLADYLVAGDGLVVDVDANGRPRVSATGGGGASAFGDLSDVTLASPADDEAALFDSVNGDWRNRSLTAGDIKTGTLGVARGGTGLGSFTSGAILVGAGPALSFLDPTAGAGILKSDGVSWSSSVLVAGDIPGLDASKIITGTFDVARIPDLNASKIDAGTFGAGDYTFPGNAVITALKIGEASHSLVSFTAAANFAQPSGYRTMVQQASGGSTQLPPGWTSYGFYQVMARRDSGAGYHGLFFGYNSGRAWVAENTVGTSTPNWHEVLTEDTPSFTAQALTAQSLNLNTALAVSEGGTGETSFTAGALLTGLGGNIGEIDPAAGAGILKSDGISWSASTLVADDIPGLDTSKIFTGTFADARIPSLAASKITSGVFSIARIPSIPVTGLTPGILDSTSWRWRGMDGTEAEPGLAFSSQINTGIRRVSTSIIGFVAAGTDRMRVVTAGAQLLSGSAGAPSLAGLSFTTSGVYWASGVVGLSVSGTSRIRATTSGASITGTITATADVQSSVSDARLKTEIVPIEGALERVGRLHGVYHRYTDEALDRWPELKSRRRAALIAQDVAEVLPEAVVPFAGDPEYLNYLPDMVIPLLVEAIHELQAEVESLRARRAA